MKLVFYTVFSLMLLYVSSYASQLQKEFYSLSVKQIEILKQAYSIGSPHNLGFTLMSIAWQESDFNRYPVNLKDPSCGVTHIKISTARKYLSRKMGYSSFAKNRICAYLLNTKTAFNIAIKELKFWKRYHHGSLYQAISSYNGGYRGNKRYAKEVWNKIRFLRNHIQIK